MKAWMAIVVCAACSTGCIGVNQGGRPFGSILRAEVETPQPGEWCRVTYPEQRTGVFEKSQSQLTGRVESVDEDGIHLSHVTGRNMVKSPGLDRIPYVNRLFRNTGVGTEHDRVVKLDGTEEVEIISKQEAWQPQAQVLAQQLTAAVPGPSRLH
jgi:hypothetical protein